jgi:hypothetical protein
MIVRGLPRGRFSRLEEFLPVAGLERALKSELGRSPITLSPVFNTPEGVQAGARCSWIWSRTRKSPTILRNCSHDFLVDSKSGFGRVAFAGFIEGMPRNESAEQEHHALAKNSDRVLSSTGLRGAVTRAPPCS